jgi:hypothetical protein
VVTTGGDSDQFIAMGFVVDLAVRSASADATSRLGLVLAVLVPAPRTRVRAQRLVVILAVGRAGVLLLVSVGVRACRYGNS